MCVSLVTCRVCAHLRSCLASAEQYLLPCLPCHEFRRLFLRRHVVKLVLRRLGVYFLLGCNPCWSQFGTPDNESITLLRQMVHHTLHSHQNALRRMSFHAIAPASYPARMHHHAPTHPTHVGSQSHMVLGKAAHYFFFRLHSLPDVFLNR